MHRNDYYKTRTIKYSRLKTEMEYYYLYLWAILWLTKDEKNCIPDSYQLSYCCLTPPLISSIKTRLRIEWKKIDHTSAPSADPMANKATGPTQIRTTDLLLHLSHMFCKVGINSEENVTKLTQLRKCWAISTELLTVRVYKQFSETPDKRDLSWRSRNLVASLHILEIMANLLHIVCIMTQNSEYLVTLE